MRILESVTRGAMLLVALALLHTSSRASNPDQEPPQLSLAFDPANPGASSLAAREIPPDGSVWLEVGCCTSPAGDLFIRNHVQDSYQDNGDGIVSVGDFVTLRGVAHEVLEVGERIFAHVTHGPCCPVHHYWGIYGDLATSPHYPDFSRVNELYPSGASLDPIWYEDINENGIVDSGDKLHWTYVIFYEADIYYVGPYVRLQDFDAVPAEPTTWSRLKTLMGAVNQPPAGS